MYPDKLGSPWPTSQEWERGSSRQGIGRRGGIERVSVCVGGGGIARVGGGRYRRNR